MQIKADMRPQAIFIVGVEDWTRYEGQSLMRAEGHGNLIRSQIRRQPKNDLIEPCYPRKIGGRLCVQGELRNPITKCFVRLILISARVAGAHLGYKLVPVWAEEGDVRGISLRVTNFNTILFGP
ncbi:hypothetical protein TrCOL_g10890 [Triparma columacea]|uniref:Uncharacterized protein n=1 Tax=Triparma columacea TaxID=722753 RepID=A0A9W7L823_9STRA|nr:hypothetical protein TrCOL_g10890 [Triparma columacea]